MKILKFNRFVFFSDMEAECSDDVMKLTVKFNDSFSGLIYSAGKLETFNAEREKKLSKKQINQYDKRDTKKQLWHFRLANFPWQNKNIFLRKKLTKNLRNLCQPDCNRLCFLEGYAYDNDCIYINGTGSDEYEFYIQLNRCGTLGGSDHNKKRDASNFKNTEPTVSSKKSCIWQKKWKVAILNCPMAPH